MLKKDKIIQKKEKKKEIGYIWAFDLSLSCTGISIFTNDSKYILSTSIETGKLKTRPEKLKYIGEKIIELHKKYPASEIVIEQGFTRYNISTQTIFMVNGLVEYLFSEFPQFHYAATTVKKQVGGIGNMKKDVLRDIILKKYPKIKFNNFDESDSFAVGICHLIKEYGFEGII